MRVEAHLLHPQGMGVFGYYSLPVLSLLLHLLLLLLPFASDLSLWSRCAVHYVHVDTGLAPSCAAVPFIRTAEGGALCVCVLQVLDIAAQHGMLVLIEVKELHKRGELIRQLVQLFADRDLYVPHMSSKRSWRAMLRLGLCKPPCCPVCKPPCLRHSRAALLPLCVLFLVRRSHSISFTRALT